MSETKKGNFSKLIVFLVRTSPGPILYKLGKRFSMLPLLHIMVLSLTWPRHKYLGRENNNFLGKAENVLDITEVEERGYWPRKITVARTEGGGLYKCCLIADNNKYRIVNTAIKGQLANNGILSWKRKNYNKTSSSLLPSASRFQMGCNCLMSC